jgi:formate dehydrogenase subunit gamma
MQQDPTAIAGRVIEIVDQNRSREGPLMPILNAVQAEFGCVPAEAIRVIASELNLTRAEVHGVVSFYHDYRTHPAGRHVLKLCRAEACQSMRGDSLSERARALLGVDWHGTTADGAVTLEPVFCLGLCATAPSAMLDGKLIARLDDAKLDRILEEVRS